MLCYTPRKGWGVDIRLLRSCPVLAMLFLQGQEILEQDLTAQGVLRETDLFFLFLFFFISAVLLLGSAKLPERAGSWAARSLLLGACSTQQMGVGKEENEQ